MMIVPCSQVTAGVVVTGDDTFPLGDGDRALSMAETEAVVLSAGFIARAHPGYDPREFCIVGTDGVTSDVGCVTLNFIGRNDDAPVIMYASRGVATFTEGGTDFIPIVDGTFNITDQDHPSYLQMSASARILGFIEGNPEFLGLTYTPQGFNVTYDQAAGTLTVSGEATVQVYEQLLLNLTYLNNMLEPHGISREIEVTVFDGVFTSQPAIVRVNINNTNDAPSISLDGVAPVIISLSAQYTEGDAATVIVPNLQVMDVDPNAMIQRAVVDITNELDRGMEILNVSVTPSGPEITAAGSQLRLEGPRPFSVYTAILQTLTYQHLDGNPGNPNTSESRIITFQIEDTAGASNSPLSILYLTIVPVNDAPILLFVSNDADMESGLVQTSGPTTAAFTYTEDDPPLSVGTDIYLRDVDGNIASATITLSNLLNGALDDVYINQTLLSWYGVTQTSSSSSSDSRTITLNGTAIPGQYEQILQSLSYRNLFSNDSVANGTRMISITANDTYEAMSNLISVTIDVSFRNDGPVLDIGAGPNMDYMITFEEDGFSIPIVLQHVLSLMDEEDHSITRVTIQLMALNGDLDPTDTLIPRTPFPMEFVDNLFRPLTDDLIDIAPNGTVSADLYRSIIQSVYYTNDADEPTLFNANGSLLVRVITISIYDDRFDNRATDLDGSISMGVTNLTIGVTIRPINDHVPMISLSAEPTGCAFSGGSVASDTGGVLQRARRSTSWALASSRRRRRLVDVHDDSKAPKVASAVASFTDKGCLNLVTVTFNSHTNAPIVATKRSIDSILTFDSPEVNSAVRFGVWLDYSQLVVVFGGCVERKSVQRLNDRGVRLYLEADRGSCDWSSECSDHVICFKNLTGCPTSGQYIVTVKTPCSPGSGCSQNTTSATPPSMEYSFYSEVTIASVLITLMVVLAVFIFLCIRSCFTTRRQAKPLPIDLDFRDSTVISMPSEVETIPEDIGAGMQEVLVLDSPPQPTQKGKKNTPKGTTFSVRSKTASQKKERRKLEREKKKDRKGTEDGDARIPILQEEHSNDDDDDDVITIFPEAGSQRLSQDDQQSSEMSLSLRRGEQRDEAVEEDHPISSCHRELSVRERGPSQPVTTLASEVAPDRQASMSKQAELKGSNQ